MHAKYQIEIDEVAGLSGARALALALGGDITAYVPAFDGDLPMVMIELGDDRDETVAAAEQHLGAAEHVAAFWRTL